MAGGCVQGVLAERGEDCPVARLGRDGLGSNGQRPSVRAGPNTRELDDRDWSIEEHAERSGRYKSIRGHLRIDFRSTPSRVFIIETFLTVDWFRSFPQKQANI